MHGDPCKFYVPSTNYVARVSADPMAVRDSGSVGVAASASTGGGCPPQRWHNHATYAVDDAFKLALYNEQK